MIGKRKNGRRFFAALGILMALPLLATSWPTHPRPFAPGGMPLAGKPAAKPKQSVGNWARLALDSMSLDEKIGQLFMVAAYSNKEADHVAAIEKLVRDEKIGGLIFMQGGPGRQINLVNRYQKAARFPLLIATDAEWGLGMRLDSTISFPKNMTLGAIRDSMPIFEMGMEVGKHCRRVGVHVNFAPVVDVNNNPRNPVINDRSYGEDRENVFIKGLFMYKGMEYSGTIGCAKHFPGHGDTDTDSHADLPLIPFTKQRLDSLELYPFKSSLKGAWRASWSPTCTYLARQYAQFGKYAFAEDRHGPLAQRDGIQWFGLHRCPRHARRRQVLGRRRNGSQSIFGGE
ncbi:MAG: hypothetical protein IPP17_02485 [Bacteroidetes bacterium]|nr:hypothetical protein [Bacteroidota bacterium]